MTMSIYAQNDGLVARANAAAPLDGPQVGNVPRGIGTEVNQCANRIKAYYNFAISGGATGKILLLDDQGNPAMMPKGAVVIQALAYVITAPVGSGASISLAMLSTADLMAATAITSLTAGVAWQGKPVTGGAGAAWTVVGPVTAQYGSQLSVTISGAALTAGEVAFYIDYIDTN